MDTKRPPQPCQRRQPASGIPEYAYGPVVCHFVLCIRFFAGITSLINMMEACGEALSSRLKLSRRLSVAVVAAVVFGVSVFLEALPNMGAWLDTVTIYIAPFGALLCAVFIYFILGMPAIKKELNQGRKKPLGRSFDILAHIYVAVAAAVLVLGIVYGGIG